jgi:hypothetical protein
MGGEKRLHCGADRRRQAEQIALPFSLRHFQGGREGAIHFGPIGIAHGAAFWASIISALENRAYPFCFCRSPEILHQHQFVHRGVYPGE